MTDISDSPEPKNSSKPLYAVVCHSSGLETSVVYGYGRKHANEMAEYIAGKLGGAWRIFKASAND